uniref:Reverse transcriptase domain-containing protein n=1 Tax=Colletotrichum fructicola (strain Nara gc5) TaxID=1213859 RepID=L2G6C8_COLFN
MLPKPRKPKYSPKRYHPTTLLSKKFWIKIGVPQCSPLSPILFVFFTIPILRRLRESRTLESEADMTIFQLFDLVITGYVDDITILLASSSYELNCEALAQVYRRLTRFTSLHGTEFSADKTQVIHLCQSRKAPPIVNVMPNVSGFPTEAKDDAIKVLGLHLDYQLKWNVHMAHTLAKVRQKMYQMRRVCGSTWGPDVLKLRHQYITSVRPIFAYACALWYVVRRTKGTRCKWSLCQALVNKLETEQTQCLKQFFGAYQRVSGDTLCKEFFVEKLCVSLAGSHPLNVAYREAKALVWMVADDELQLRIRADPKLAKNSALRRLRRKQLIRDVVKKMSHFKSQDLWQKFVIRSAAFNENCPAIQGIWGQHNLKIWVDMPKAQSTILLHIRTGFNGLNATLHFMGLAPSHMCPCGKGVHNAKHLFLHCKLLEDARKHLRKALLS